MLTKTDIEKYFIAEKQFALLLCILGIITIIIALLGLFIWKGAFWKGASIPFIALAILQSVVGYFVYNKSDADRVSIVYALDMNPADLKNKELPRMETVNKKFVTYKYIEVAFLIIGLVLIFIYKSNNEKEFILGIAVALTIEATILFAVDTVAEKRAHHYTQLLKETIH